METKKGWEILLELHDDVDYDRESCLVDGGFWIPLTW